MLSCGAQREGWVTALHLWDLYPALCSRVKGRAIGGPCGQVLSRVRSDHQSQGVRGDGAQRGGGASALSPAHRMCESNFPLKCSKRGCLQTASALSPGNTASPPHLCASAKHMPCTGQRPTPSWEHALPTPPSAPNAFLSSRLQTSSLPLSSAPLPSRTKDKLQPPTASL